MILVDTSIWIDHLRVGEPKLAELLEDAMVSTHPMVIGELALGTMRNRARTLALLSALPAVLPAAHAEVLRFIETARLHGNGLSVVDVHLLAAARITAGTRLWTRDKRLRSAAQRFGVLATDLA